MIVLKVCRQKTASLRRSRTATVVGVLALWLGLTAQSYGPADLDEAFDRAVIVLSASSGNCFRVDVWVASERAQQTRGLMFVRDLPEQHGMIFLYPEPGRRSMWMKNTYIPLDILFIRASGRITNIARHTEPLSLRSISSSEPVNYVLELNAGAAERLGIEAGDSVVL